MKGEYYILIIQKKIREVDLIFETGNYFFSRNSIDKGTLLMLNMVDVNENDKVLDLGCGYGVVGIYIAKKIGGENVVMSDILNEAISLTRKNIELNDVRNCRVIKSNGLKSIDDDDFTLILSNPPYHTDFSVAKSFIEDGFKKLKIGGKMIIVTKRLEWYKNKIQTVFGGVKVYEIEDYYIFVGEKRMKYVKKKKKNRGGLSKKLNRKYSKK